MNCGLYRLGEIHDVRCSFQRKDGKIIHVLRNGKVVNSREGKPVGAVESLIDITEHLCAEQELTTLRKTVEQRTRFGKMVGKSPAMQEIYDLVDEVSDSTATVMITGESGTGKELLADAIHFSGPRKNKPFIKVNCAALPETLLESELFGHVRGAFTGAHMDKPGRFELADNGTLFLDEIGDLSATVQVKLLRVLQERSFERLGSGAPVKVDVRIIAASNRDIAGLVKQGLFREDLFYRLNVIPIRMPALRERTEDVPLLVKFFIDKFNHETGKNIRKMDEDAMALFLDYHWPGNIRELENAMEHAFVRTKKNVIELFSLPQGLRRVRFGHGNDAVLSAVPAAAQPVYAPRQPLTRETIEAGLAKARYNRSRLAKTLGVSRTTLWKKMRALGM
jgi:transcriptional regulator with PAS, ATPase and Fis domain